MVIINNTTPGLWFIYVMEEFIAIISVHGVLWFNQ